MSELIALAALCTIAQGPAPDAQALLDVVAAKLRGADALVLKLDARLPGTAHAMTMEMWRLKGGYSKTLMSGPGGGPGMETIRTPQKTWMLMASEKQYMETPSTPEIGDSMLPGIDLMGTGAAARAVGKAVGGFLRGKQVWRVKVDAPSMRAGGPSGILLIDRATGLPAGVEIGSGAQTLSLAVRELDLSAKLTPGDFEWKPPEGWTAYKPPTQQSYDANLVKPGLPAPEFRALTPAGKITGLKEELRGHKALLVNFWFYG